MDRESLPDPEQFKAWSQNLGHEQVMTTLLICGTVPRHRQGEIMRDLGQHPEAKTPPDTLAEQIAAAVERRIMKK